MNYDYIKDCYFEQERDVGFLLLPSFFSSSADARPKLLELANRIGAIRYEAGGRAIWDIRPTSDTGTFSETSEEVPPHTDAAYEAQPPAHLIMGCLVAASDGGVTSITPAKPIVNELISRLELRSLTERLFNREWSWRRPAIFDREDGLSVSSPKAVVLDNGGIQWRFNNLVYRSEDQCRFARLFDLILEYARCAQSVSLQPGDAIIISNRFALHGRTGFTDKRRHFLRVRVE